MKDCIYRDDVLQELETIHSISGSLPDGPVRKAALLTVETIKRTMSTIPPADVRHVVFCKNCAVPHNQWTGCPKLGGLVTEPDFFCAFGEPKGDSE